MVAEKSDTAVYTVTIILCILIGAASGFYNNRNKDKEIRNNAIVFLSFMGFIIGFCLALLLDYSGVFGSELEKFQIEEKMEEEEDELTLE